MTKKLPVTLVLDNIRSAYNVGSIWRTADAAGIEQLVLVGITPHPPVENDARLPHVAAKDGQTIAKTALGAETMLPFKYESDIFVAIRQLRQAGQVICALEQAESAISLFEFKPTLPLALIVGHERTGVKAGLLEEVDHILEIPQFGRKESLNVAVATGIALYQLRQI